MSVIDGYSDSYDELRGWTLQGPAGPVSGALSERRCECVMTIRDCTLLEAWLIRSAGNDEETDPALARLARKKLASARMVLSGDIEPDRAKGGSRVVYAVDGKPSAPQILSHWRHEALTESILPVISVLGLSLLGMKAGQRMPLPRSDGSVGEVSLQAVLPLSSVGPHAPQR